MPLDLIGEFDFSGSVFLTLNRGQYEIKAVCAVTPPLLKILKYFIRYSSTYPPPTVFLLEIEIFRNSKKGYKFVCLFVFMLVREDSSMQTNKQKMSPIC